MNTSFPSFHFSTGHDTFSSTPSGRSLHEVINYTSVYSLTKAVTDQEHVAIDILLPALLLPKPAIFIGLLLLYGAWRTMYCQFYHPLSSFPGPTLASITNLHRFYYNWYCSGLHLAKIKEWHAQYGPVIRIAPNELHFNDPDVYRSIYTHPGLRKEPAFYQFMSEDSLVGQLDIEVNRRKRRIFAAFFSTNAMRNLGNSGGTLHTKAIQLYTTLSQLDPGAILDVSAIARCFTYDAIKEVVLEPSNVVASSAPEFKPPFATANSTIKYNLWLAQQFPLLVTLVRALPDAVLFLISPGLVVLKEEREYCCKQVTKRSRSLEADKHSSGSICSRVVHARETQARLNISEYHLGMEMFDMLVAGTELPANAISFGVFQLARHQSSTSRLREELQETSRKHSNQLPPLTVLEKLPFLTAVVNETLRLGNLVPGRLPRVAPVEGMEVAGLAIPGGTIISASTYLVHMNSGIFPEPENFLPERWLVDETCNERRGTTLERHLFAFSTGSRDCIGRYLAIAELRVFLAVLVLYFDFKLIDPNDRTKVLTWRDNIVTSYDREVRIVIRERSRYSS